jgi:ribosome-binding protein aMBF1 (putative translation factor)
MEQLASAPAVASRSASAVLLLKKNIMIEPVNAKRAERAAGAPSPHQEPTELRRTFARNLRQAREAAGLSKLALAKAALFDSGSLGRIETHATNATLDTIEQLARALGLMAIDLLVPEMDDLILRRVRRGPREPLASKEPTELRRTFARNVRELRLAAGLQQKMLAQAASMTLARVSKIEVHAKNVTLDTVTLLAKHLGCAEVDLLRSKTN